MSKPQLVIGIQKEGNIRYVKVLRNRVNIASFGIFDTKDLADNQAAVEKLLEQGPHVFKEATKAEYDAFEKERKDQQEVGKQEEEKKPAPKSKSKPKTKEE